MPKQSKSSLSKLLLGISITLIAIVVCLRYPARLVLPGPDSEQALRQYQGEVLALEQGLAPKDSIFITLNNLKHTWNEQLFRDSHEEFFNLIKLFGNKINDSFEIRTAGHSLLGDEFYLSADLHSVLLVIHTNIPVHKSPHVLKDFPELVMEWRNSHPDFQVKYLSNGTLNNEMFSLINSDLDRSLLYSIPLTFIVLLWSFQSVAATFTTLILSIMTLLTSLASVILISYCFGPVNAMSAQLVVLLVLALCTDYSLFLIQHVRSLLKTSSTFYEAVELAINSTGKAIFWSGLTVACSLIGLFIMNDTILSSMALTAFIAVMITLAFTLHVLPAMLKLLGPRIEFGTIRKTLQVNSRGRIQLLSLALKYPIKTTFLIGTPLLILAVMSQSLILGSTVQLSFMPSTMQSRMAYEDIRRNLQDVIGDPFSVIIRPSNGLNSINEFISDEIVQIITQESDIKGPLRTELSSNQGLLRLSFIRQGTDDQLQRIKFVDKFTKDIIPRINQKFNVESYPSGKLIYDVDQANRYAEQTPEMIFTVLLLSFIFIFFAFRSLVISIKALLLNILSCCASFGVIVLVFQNGPYNYGVIESFVPALLFCVLFGLSMDYHIFLISRMRDEYLNTGNTHKAVTYGVLETYSTISAAACIMISVFLVISSLELPILKQLGMGLAFAVLIDATIIRLLLLPALMILLGKWNWYIPQIMQNRRN